MISFLNSSIGQFLVVLALFVIIAGLVKFANSRTAPPSKPRPRGRTRPSDDDGDDQPQQPHV